MPDEIVVAVSSGIEDFRRYIGCLAGSVEGGFAFAYGTDKPGDVEGNPALAQAYEPGTSV